MYEFKNVEDFYTNNTHTSLLVDNNNNSHNSGCFYSSTTDMSTVYVCQ